MQDLYAQGRLYVSVWLSVLACVLAGVLISKMYEPYGFGNWRGEARCYIAILFSP